MTRTRRHELTDIVLPAIVGAICECHGWDDVHDLVAEGPAELRALFELRHGVPSADTIGRVLGALDPRAFEQAFLAWSAAMTKSTADHSTSLMYGRAKTQWCAVDMPST